MQIPIDRPLFVIFGGSYDERKAAAEEMCRVMRMRYLGSLNPLLYDMYLEDDEDTIAYVYPQYEDGLCEIFSDQLEGRPVEWIDLEDSAHIDGRVALIMVLQRGWVVGSVEWPLASKWSVSAFQCE